MAMEAESSDSSNSDDSLQSSIKVIFLDTAQSVLIIAIIGTILFGISGIWPPMVAVESGSMEPNIMTGDLVFIVAEDRFATDIGTGSTGVVTFSIGQEEGYEKFGTYGDVIVFEPNGNSGTTPVFHRAMFWVEEGENWYGKANPDYIRGEDCEAVAFCPAPHAGFITKGDANSAYDQSGGLTAPVRPSWIHGVAEVRIPYLGRIRLFVY